MDVILGNSAIAIIVVLIHVRSQALVLTVNKLSFFMLAIVLVVVVVRNAYRQELAKNNPFPISSSFAPW